MKRILLFVCVFLTLTNTSKVAAQTSEPDWAGYLAVLDTMGTAADTATYTTSVTGPKHCITYQTNVLKISGTVSGTVKIYGSVDGTNYITTPLVSDTLRNQSENRSWTFTSNGYKKYKFEIITPSGPQLSQRTYLLWRKGG